MTCGTIALLGNLNIDRQHLDAVAAEFGWLVAQAEDLSSLRKMNADQPLMAVLFRANNPGVPWQDALERVLEAAPTALPIACTGFSESIPWTDMADAGAFHELRLPIDPGEVRRSLGFVWAAKRTNGFSDAGGEPQRAPAAKSRTSASNGFVFSGRFINSRSHASRSPVRRSVSGRPEPWL